MMLSMCCISKCKYKLVDSLQSHPGQVWRLGIFHFLAGDQNVLNMVPHTGFWSGENRLEAFWLLFFYIYIFLCMLFEGLGAKQLYCFQKQIFTCLAIFRAAIGRFEGMIICCLAVFPSLYCFADERMDELNSKVSLRDGAELLLQEKLQGGSYDSESCNSFHGSSLFQPGK